VLRRFLPLTAICAFALIFAASASAADSVWWTNYGTDAIATAPLTGGSGSALAFAPLAPSGPLGSAVDPATGKLYWSNFGNNTIAVSNLDGSGSTLLNTAGATVSNPTSLAIDRAAGRVYWMNGNANKVSWAAIDGSGGGDLLTTGAPMSIPEGVAVYPADGRIYWANSGVDSIAYANLDGSGGGAVPVPSKDLENPSGVAIDAASATIYWTNNGNGTIGYASLNGIGGGLLPITGVTMSKPLGLAIDPEAGLVYWADQGGGGGIFSVALAGGSAQRLDTGSAAVSGPSFPFLFKAPQPVKGLAAPAFLPVVKQGGLMTCGSGSWEPDLPESLLFRAPQTLSYSWTLNSAPIPGATGQMLTATVPNGRYSCQVTATNGAGSTTTGAGTWAVPSEEEGPHRPLLRILKLKRAPKSGTATVFLTVSGPGTATLRGTKVVPRTVKSSGSGVVKLKLATKGKARKRLVRTGHLKVPVTLGFRTTEGADTFISRAITLSRRR
jgi:hypothetical protein